MSDRTVTTSSPEETEAVAAAVAATLEGGDCLLLRGDLGGGKTTFVRGLVRGLAHPDPREVASPTFAIHHRYEGGRLPVDHLDLYRLEGIEDALEWQGVLDPLDDPAAVSVVEWPERLPWSPDGVALELHLMRGEGEGQRLLRPVFVGARGERIAAGWPASRDSTGT